MYLCMYLFMYLFIYSIHFLSPFLSRYSRRTITICLTHFYFTLPIICSYLLYLLLLFYSLFHLWFIHFPIYLFTHFFTIIPYLQWLFPGTHDELLQSALLSSLLFLPLTYFSYHFLFTLVIIFIFYPVCLFYFTGTHDELLQSALRGEGAGIYANLWNLQLQHRESNKDKDTNNNNTIENGINGIEEEIVVDLMGENNSPSPSPVLTNGHGNGHVIKKL